MGKAQAHKRFHIVDPSSEDTGGGGPGQSVSGQLKEVRQELSDLIAGLKDKRVTPGVGAVQVQAYNAILRALSEERKVVTEEEVERRVNELEEKMRR